MSLTDLPQTLPQWLAQNAVLRPDMVGQRLKRDGVWREYTWRTIAEEVKTIAFGLAARNVNRGDSVLIISENRPEQYWAELAALSLGAKVVAIYPDASETEIAYIAEDSGAVCIFAEDQEQVDKALPVAARHPQIRSIVWWEPGGMWNYHDFRLLSWEALKGGGEALGTQEPALIEQSVQNGQSDDIALLTYTSGTTGKPKGVITTHASLQHNARLLAEALGTTAGCEYLSYIPLSWATEQWIGVTLGLMQPLCVNFAERPDQIQSAIRELACGMVFFGPRQWESLATLVHTRMADAPRWRQRVVEWAVGVGHRTRVAANEDKPITLIDRALLPLAEVLVLQPLREQLGLKNALIAMTGGAAISPDVFRLFAAMGVTLRNVYGCSEFGLITIHHVKNSVNVETVGAPIVSGTQWGMPMAWRLTEVGELQVKGGSGFKGYWGKPDKSEERMDGDWYRTGDAVSLVTDKEELVYLDRLDHLSRLAGGQTYPKQFIESRLRFSPYIKEVMVVGDERHDFVTALVNIDGEVLARWAEHEALSFTTFTDLSQRPEVLARIGHEIERVNAALPDHAKVMRFANLPKELDADEGELTRTRKLKREVIEERYGTLVDAMYSTQDHVAVEIPVRYQDGRSGILRADVLIGGDAFAHQERA